MYLSGVKHDSSPRDVTSLSRGHDDMVGGGEDPTSRFRFRVRDGNVTSGRAEPSIASTLSFCHYACLLACACKICFIPLGKKKWMHQGQRCCLPDAADEDDGPFLGGLAERIRGRWVDGRKKKKG